MLGAVTLQGMASAPFLWGLRRMGRRPRVRRALLGAVERRLRARSPRELMRQPAPVTQDKLALTLAVLGVIERVLADDRLSDASLRGLLGRLLHDVLWSGGDGEAKRRFAARHGCTPPDFLTLSPGRACNLRCVGCYANAGLAREKLPFAVLDRIVNEARQLWGTRFFVVSGGEPLAYRDGGLGVLDLAERHQDCFFLFYTNGTLITDELARRLARLGNLSPGLSVEGRREATDERRGRGVFDRVLAAMERLRGERVAFGVSLTATSENADEILSDEVVELFFDRMGALYAWLFHYMPIGRASTLQLMPTPEQRIRLLERVWSLVRERRLPIMDFWNSGVATNGCIAGGRAGGYLYVDWNGNVNPCVFIPYSPVNIHRVYAAGGSIEDAWGQPFFAAIRAWQRDYGYRQVGEPGGRFGNWLRPCLIRDHHAAFRRLVDEHRPRPTDDDLATTVHDPAYHAGMEDFDQRLADLLDPVWESQYLGSPPAARGQGAVL